MLIRIMTLKFNPVLEQFDDAALQDYLKDKETLSVRDHFFIKNDTPYITLIIQLSPLVPKLRLGNALVGEAPASRV